jgi:hypothetical protein
MAKARHMKPGARKERFLEEFKIQIYQDSRLEEFEALQRRDWALIGYLSSSDETKEDRWTYHPPLCNGVNLWGQLKCMSGAVTGMGGFALD